MTSQTYALPSTTTAYLRRKALQREEREARKGQLSSAALPHWLARSSRWLAGLVGLALLSVAATATAESIDESFVTGANARLDLSNVAGEIYITGWDEKSIQLGGDLADNAELKLKHDNQRVTVKVVKKSGFRRMGGTELRVRVPFDSELSIYAVSSDLSVEAVLGTQRLEVVSGDIRVDGFANDLQVRSVSGDVYLSGGETPGRVRVVSVSGDTDIRDVAGELETSSVSGDTIVAGTEFDRVRIKSTSGRVDFTGALVSGGRLDAEAISGGIEINLGAAESVDVEVETFSGRIRNCTSEESQRKSKYGPGRQLHFTRGAADRDVRVRSMSGSVDLCAR